MARSLTPGGVQEWAMRADQGWQLQGELHWVYSQMRDIVGWVLGSVFIYSFLVRAVDREVI